MRGSDIAPGRIEDISTRWSQLGDPVQFMFRYGPAIRRYLSALLDNPADVEDISQDIVVSVINAGFAHASPDKGRFRNYLKTSVRNAAFKHRSRKRPGQLSNAAAEQLGGPDAERDWVDEWRRCALARAWAEIEAFQERTRGNLFATVLRLRMEHPKADSSELAAKASELAGRHVGESAARQQLSRARKKFAELLVDEARRTLENPTPEAVRDELIEVGLMPWVRGYVEL